MTTPRLFKFSVDPIARAMARKGFDLRPTFARESSEEFQGAADRATTTLGRMVYYAHAAVSSESAGDYAQHAFLVEQASKACEEHPCDLSHLLTSLLRGPTATDLPQ